MPVFRDHPSWCVIVVAALATTSCSKHSASTESVKPAPQRLIPKNAQDAPLTKDDLKTDADSAAFVFALHDLGNRKLVTRTSTAPYKTALDELTDIYGLNHAEIANRTLAAVQPLEDKGIDFKFSDILAAMKRFNTKNGSSFAELIATYTVFREKGTTHNDTVRQIDALLNALSGESK